LSQYPVWNGKRPVAIDARAGQHNGLAVYALAKRVPRAASPSSAGVRTTGLPRAHAARMIVGQEKSSSRVSPGSLFSAGRCGSDSGAHIGLPEFAGLVADEKAVPLDQEHGRAFGDFEVPRDEIVGDHGLQEFLGAQEDQPVALFEQAVEQVVLQVGLVEPRSERGRDEAGGQRDRHALHELHAADFEHVVAPVELQQVLQVGRGAFPDDAQHPGDRIVRQRADAEIPVGPEHAALELGAGDEGAATLPPVDQAAVFQVVERAPQRAAAHAEVGAQVGFRRQFVARAPAAGNDLAGDVPDLR
jgi:hypothetical protein